MIILPDKKGMITVTHKQLVEIGRRIRDRRKAMGLTQERAAELIDVSLTHFKNIEHGRSAMSLATLMNVCERFSLDQTYLLTGKNIGSNPIIDFYNSLPEKKKQCFERTMYYLDQLLER